MYLEFLLREPETTNRDRKKNYIETLSNEIDVNLDFQSNQGIVVLDSLTNQNFWDQNHISFSCSRKGCSCYRNLTINTMTFPLSSLKLYRDIGSLVF